MSVLCVDVSGADKEDIQKNSNKLIVFTLRKIRENHKGKV